MEGLKDLREIMSCPCLRMRRATRQTTQLYDHVLAGAGLTANQFGLLAYLYRADLANEDGLSIGKLAEQAGVDPTTLNRNLKALDAHNLTTNGRGSSDGRVRVVRITQKGKRTLQRAFPLWREARAQVEVALGSDALIELNALLDRAGVQISRVK
jgi:DNA-binding MarR family transcriptional regulator